MFTTAVMQSCVAKQTERQRRLFRQIIHYVAIRRHQRDDFVEACSDSCIINLSNLWLDIVRLVILKARLIFDMSIFEVLVWNAMVFLDVNVCLGKK